MAHSATQQAVEDFGSRLTDLGLVGRPSEDVPLKRAQLYKFSVLVEGTKVTDRHYDRKKPSVFAVKLFLDLLYNVNLAKALGKALVTPTDSLHRSLLVGITGDTSVDVPTVAEVVQNALFLFSSQEGVPGGVSRPHVV